MIALSRYNYYLLTGDFISFFLFNRVIYDAADNFFCVLRFGCEIFTLENLFANFALFISV